MKSYDLTVCWIFFRREPCVEQFGRIMALYEDEFCLLDETSVTLKWYYFPTFGDKKIPRDSILDLQVPAPTKTKRQTPNKPTDA